MRILMYLTMNRIKTAFIFEAVSLVSLNLFTKEFIFSFEAFDKN